MSIYSVKPDREQIYAHTITDAIIEEVERREEWQKERHLIPMMMDVIKYTPMNPGVNVPEGRFIDSLEEDYYADWDDPDRSSDDHNLNFKDREILKGLEQALVHLFDKSYHVYMHTPSETITVDVFATLQRNEPKVLTRMTQDHWFSWMLESDYAAKVEKEQNEW